MNRGGADAKRQQRALEAVRAVWIKNRPRILSQIEDLARAVETSARRELSDDARTQARGVAHKLAGSLGTYGFMRASELALEVETALAGPDLIGDHARLQVAVEELRGELGEEAGGAPPAESPPVEVHPTVLVVTSDGEMGAALASEVAARGLTPKVLSPASPVVETDTSAAAAIVDLGPGDDGAGPLALVDYLVGLDPSVPTIALADPGSGLDRVAVARHGAGELFSRHAGYPSIAAAAARAVAGPKHDHTLLVVDDDPSILDAVKALFLPTRIRVVTVAGSAEFFPALERCRPDAVLLDIEMPGRSGIDLCRAVRGDPARVGLPVIFLTADRTRETVNSVFASGGDDFIVKPIVGPEVVARVRARLGRLDLLRRVTEMDRRAGILNRRGSERAVNGLLKDAGAGRRMVTLAVIRVAPSDEASGPLLSDLADAIGEIVGKRDVIGLWDEHTLVAGLVGRRQTQAMKKLRIAVTKARVLDPDRTIMFGTARFPREGATLAELCDVALRRSSTGSRGNPLEEPAEVLIVEDDESLGDLLVHALEERGHRTYWVKDAETALEQFTNLHQWPRLVLLDVNLPGQGGLELLAHMGSTGVLATTRVVMLTASSHEEVVLKALELGAFDHIAKPFSLPVLVERVGRAVGR